MAGEFYRSWWREMGAISRGMMFIEGQIATPSAVEDTQATASATPVVELPAEQAGEAARLQLKGAALRLFEDLLLLGGRPAGVRHNDDIDEPFPPLHRRSQALARHGRRQAPRPCATC